MADPIRRGCAAWLLACAAMGAGAQEAASASAPAGTAVGITPSSAPGATVAGTASAPTVARIAPAAVPTAVDPAIEARMLDITSELRCLVCQNQTIADSHADLANDLRQEVREMLKRGQTPAQIRTYMTDRYGDFILYRPPLKASTAVLWAGPGLLLVIALAALAAVIVRRSRLGDDRFEADPVDDDDDVDAVGAPPSHPPAPERTSA